MLSNQDARHGLQRNDLGWTDRFLHLAGTHTSPARGI